MTTANRHVAIYARVSTAEQTTENQLIELRRYVEARGWTATEYVDHGVSGSKDRRPALDQLTADVRRHKVSAVVCWRLDRLGRNLRHLVLLLDEWQARGVAFVTLGEGIDTSTAAGRLVAGVLGSIAEFERARIQERIHAGLRRAKAQGRRLGRRRSAAARQLETCAGLTHAAAALQLCVSEASIKRWRRAERGRSESLSSVASNPRVFRAAPPPLPPGQNHSIVNASEEGISDARPTRTRPPVNHKRATPAAATADVTLTRPGDITAGDRLPPSIRQIRPACAPAPFCRALSAQGART